MHQARIAPLDPPYDTETAAALQSIMPPGMEPLKLFRTQARNLRVFKRMVAGNLLHKGSITLRERELLIRKRVMSTVWTARQRRRKMSRAETQ